MQPAARRIVIASLPPRRPLSHLINIAAGFGLDVVVTCRHHEATELESIAGTRWEASPVPPSAALDVPPTSYRRLCTAVAERLDGFSVWHAQNNQPAATALAGVPARSAVSSLAADDLEAVLSRCARRYDGDTVSARIRVSGPVVVTRHPRRDDPDAPPHTDITVAAATSITDVMAHPNV